MKVVIMKREYKNDRTLGTLEVYNGTELLKTFRSLELPFVGNQRNISCIPLGAYKVCLSHSPKFGECYRLQDVPGRDGILIHKGNYTKNTQGCILVGESWIDLNNDGKLDVANTCEATEELKELMGEEFILYIV